MSSTQPNPVKHRGTTEDAPKLDKTQSQSNENDDPAQIELTDGSTIDAQHYEFTLVNSIDTSVEGLIDIDPIEGCDSIDITTSATASLADDEDADGDTVYEGGPTR